MAYDASTLPDVSGLTVGIIGGTGDQGGASPTGSPGPASPC